MLEYEDQVRPAAHVCKYEYLDVYEKIRAYNEAVTSCIRFNWRLPQPQSFALSTVSAWFDHETGYVESYEGFRVRHPGLDPTSAFGIRGIWDWVCGMC